MNNVIRRMKGKPVAEPSGPFARPLVKAKRRGPFDHEADGQRDQGPAAEPSGSFARPLVEAKGGLSRHVYAQFRAKQHRPVVIAGRISQEGRQTPFDLALKRRLSIHDHSHRLVEVHDAGR